MASTADNDEDIVGRDIEAAQARPDPAKGRAIPKVEEVSEEEDEEEDDLAVSAAQPAHPRNEVEPGTKDFRTTAVHVYGLDFLKTGHMEEIFGQFHHKYIEWINDSCANVVFNNAVNAKKALESLSFPKPEDEPWRRTPDIMVSEDVPPIFLQMRLATAKDVKKAKRSVPKAMPAIHYTQSFARNKGKGKGGRRRLNSDSGPERPIPHALAKSRSQPKAKAAVWAGGTAKRTPPAPVTEEESSKRQKRGERFGDGKADEAVSASKPAAESGDGSEAPADSATVAESGGDDIGSAPKETPAESASSDDKADKPAGDKAPDA